MLPDNRLDFISNIHQDFINMMTTTRQQFINLDSTLQIFSSLSQAEKEGVNRCLSIARTHIETALQYTIKALCLMGEIKEEVQE